MKRVMLDIGLLLLVVNLLGCLPKRVEWSPDGQRAVFISGSELYLLDMRAYESPKQIAENIALAKWFPDSRHLLLAGTTTFTRWDALQDKLIPAKRAEMIALAEKLRTEVLSYQGNWEKFRPSMGLAGGELAATLMYLRDVRSDELKAKLGDEWSKLEKIEVQFFSVQNCEVKDEQIKDAKMIWDSLNEIGYMRISPNGKLVACVAQSSGEKHAMAALFVVPLDGSAARHVADGVSTYPDWSADGQYLVYAASALPGIADDDTNVLGTISRRRICGQDGVLLDELGEPEDLASVVNWPFTKTHCLGDGRILFSAAEMTLPTASKEPEPRVSIFTLDPKSPDKLVHVLTDEAQEKLGKEALLFYEVSPDEKHIAISGAENGILVFTLDSKECAPFPLEGQKDVPLFPTWRNSDELCIAVEKGSKWGSADRHEVILWSMKKQQGRCLSTEWPDEVINGLVGKDDK